MGQARDDDDDGNSSIYDDSVLTLDRATMHFYPMPSPPCLGLRSIDIISGLHATRTESTMRFRVCARPPRPVVHSNARTRFACDSQKCPENADATLFSLLLIFQRVAEPTRNFSIVSRRRREFGILELLEMNVFRQRDVPKFGNSRRVQGIGNWSVCSNRPRSGPGFSRLKLGVRNVVRIRRDGLWNFC